MIFADTGWFVAVTDPADRLHRRAARWLRHIREPVISTDLVFLETFNFLSAVSVRRRCHKTMTSLLAKPNIAIERIDFKTFEAGLRLHHDRPDKTWSLTDCVSFVLMKQRGITRALAHDHHFEQAGFEA